MLVIVAAGHCELRNRSYIPPPPPLLSIRAVGIDTQNGIERERGRGIEKRKRERRGEREEGGWEGGKGELGNIGSWNTTVGTQLVHTHTYIYIHAHTYVPAHIHSHTYAHMHVHAHMQHS